MSNRIIRGLLILMAAGVVAALLCGCATMQGTITDPNTGEIVYYFDGEVDYIGPVMRATQGMGTLEMVGYAVGAVVAALGTGVVVKKKLNGKKKA